MSNVPPTATPSISDKALASAYKAILITGSTGFLGSFLARRLSQTGIRVVAVIRPTSDLRRLRSLSPEVELCNCDMDSVARAIRDNGVQCILHCATDYGRSLTPPSETVEANLILPLKLLQVAAETGVRSFVNSDTILDKRVGHYSLSKKQFVDWLELFSDRMVCANVALEHFYGPRDDRSKFVMNLITELLAGVPEFQLTPGEQRRDFIYIDDVVEAFMTVLGFCATAEKAFHRFEVGSGTLVRIRDFAALAKEIAGNRTTRLHFGAIPYRKHEIMESKVDTSKLAGLGWRARVSLREGLTRTVEAERTAEEM